MEQDEETARLRLVLEETTRRLRTLEDQHEQSIGKLQLSLSQVTRSLLDTQVREAQWRVATSEATRLYEVERDAARRARVQVALMSWKALNQDDEPVKAGAQEMDMPMDVVDVADEPVQELASRETARQSEQAKPSASKVPSSPKRVEGDGSPPISTGTKRPRFSGPKFTKQGSNLAFQLQMTSKASAPKLKTGV